MRKVVLIALCLFVLLLLPAMAPAAGFQFQSVGTVGFAQPVFVAAPVPVNVGCGFGFAAAPVGFGNFNAVQIQGGRRGFRGVRGVGRGQQIQSIGGAGAFGNALQINQRRGILGGIRSQQIQSVGPNGVFQLNQ